ncbi:MAG TPA: branched-chain amino acid ABC transporter permease [Chloroflexia bacterium]|nr:branched-chain amino acid ABC transporter permease [Chloroflexia bacterium]
MSLNLVIMLLCIALGIVASQRGNRRLSGAGLGLLAVLLLITPFISNNRDNMSNVYIIGLAAVGWNIIGGFTGYASFGQVAFWGLGAYAAVVTASVPNEAQTTLGWPIWLGFLMSALIPALAALLIGWPVLRLRGHYFAIATLGVAIAVREIFKNVDCIGNKLVCLGGSSGLQIQPIVKASERDFNSFLRYFVILLMFVGAVVFSWYLTRSKFGYGLFAIRENEEAAGVLGINTTWFKIGAFCLAAAFAGLGGAWRAMVNGSIYPTEDSIFDTSISLYLIIICLLGGVGTVWGPFIGAFIYSAIQEFLGALQGVPGFGWVLDWKNVIFGAIIILLVVFLPKGILQLVGNKGGFTWKIFLRNIREHSV